MLADLEQAGEDFKIMLKEVEQARLVMLVHSYTAVMLVASRSSTFVARVDVNFLEVIYEPTSRSCSRK